MLFGAIKHDRFSLLARFMLSARYVPACFDSFNLLVVSSGTGFFVVCLEKHQTEPGTPGTAAFCPAETG